MNIYFKDLNDVINFLLQTEEWADWEVIKLQMSTSDGISLVLNTKITDPYSRLEYQSLRKLKSIITTFINDNNGSSFVFDIKIRLPKEMKSSFDPKNEYMDFFVDFFSASSLNIVSPSQLEKSLQSSSDPINNWINYVQLKADKWKNANNYITG